MVGQSDQHICYNMGIQQTVADMTYNVTRQSLVLLNGLLSFYISPFLNFKYLGQYGRSKLESFSMSV